MLCIVICALWLQATAQNAPAPPLNQIERAAADARAQPRNAAAAGTLAMTLHAYQQYDAAAIEYERAHSLEPQKFDWIYLLGAVQMAQGAFSQAVGSFQVAVRLRPDSLPAQLRLAQCLAALADWGRAAALYWRMLEEHPDSAQAWYGLGRIEAANGDHAASVRSYTRACELFPRYGAAQFGLAAELRALGKKAEAESHLAAYSENATAEPPLDDPLFRRISELNQGSQVHIRRGAELEKTGRLKEAIEEHERALAIEPANVQVNVNLISLYGRTGDVARARQHFEAAIALNAGRADAWYNYGVLLVGENRYPEAEQAFHRSLDINPQYAEARTNLGALYEQQGRLDDAEREFRQAIADQPNDPLARFHLGRILVNRQKYDEAIRQFLRALEPEDEKTGMYLYALAATYARAGNRERALEYFQKAHSAAAARGQSQLLSSIDRDFKAVRGAQ